MPKARPRKPQTRPALSSAVQKWKKNKWAPVGNPDNAQAEYDRHLQAMFAGPEGEYVLNRWLADVYCTVSHVPGGRCCDTAFNDGQRAFIHEILVSLDRIENSPKTEVDTDAELVPQG